MPSLMLSMSRYSYFIENTRYKTSDRQIEPLNVSIVHHAVIDTSLYPPIGVETCASKRQQVFCPMANIVTNRQAMSQIRHELSITEIVPLQSPSDYRALIDREGEWGQYLNDLTLRLHILGNF